MSDQNQLKGQIDPLLVRVEEAARLLSLSRSMIYQMMNSGELPYLRCGTARRIPIAGIQEWIARQLRQRTESL